MDKVEYCFERVVENLGRSRVGSVLSFLELIALGLSACALLPPSVEGGLKTAAKITAIASGADFGIRACTGYGINDAVKYLVGAWANALADRIAGYTGIDSRKDK